MTSLKSNWDYLIVTAANDDQGGAYKAQLRLREGLGLLTGAGEVLVLADPGGKRIGSGGSTLYCLMEVLRRELRKRGGDPRNPKVWRKILEALRILIVHAGGDARRLPAYGPFGKLFVPVPGESDSAASVTLFDRQIPTFLALPSAPPGAGQTVIASGDVLLTFDPGAVKFDAPGITGLGCPASPDEASRHGVFCTGGGGEVRRFLQKPSPEEQEVAGAVDRYGRTLLDIGVMSFDARTAARLLDLFGAVCDDRGRWTWTSEMGRAIEDLGLDFYREVCCALGKEATVDHLKTMARKSGSRWEEPLLSRIFAALRETPFSAQILHQCGFHHFGTTHQIIHSGLEVLGMDEGTSRLRTCLQIGNLLGEQSRVAGTNAWVEGCRIESQLALKGHNILVGVEVDEPLTLPARACLNVMPGRTGEGKTTWFVLCYGVEDLFKDAVEEGALFCNRPVHDWLTEAGISTETVWNNDIPPAERTLWDGRLFPAVERPEDYRQFLWMFTPDEASSEQKKAFEEAERYSLQEISRFADPEAFYGRRALIRAEEIRKSLRRMFRLESGFSAEDLVYVLAHLPPPDRAPWVLRLLDEAHWQFEGADPAARHAYFAFSRIIHTLGTAMDRLVDATATQLDCLADATVGQPDCLTDAAAGQPDGIAPGLADGTADPPDRPGESLAESLAASLADSAAAEMEAIFPGLRASLSPARMAWLEEIGLDPAEGAKAAEWAARAKASAVAHVGRSILTSGAGEDHAPECALKADEIVWGRAPARLDLGGGWTDTPPYSLEQGGAVINAAVNLNGQSPIHAYARVISEPIIRITSIDLGTRIEIRELEDLLDFRSATSEFALAKAALTLSGFSPEGAKWPGEPDLEGMLKRFGGGIELTTLAAIPKGSGLGTSSIVGAVILAVLQRVLGRALSRRELFHGVLRLEQALTTGGGWQDQVGGAVDGVKVATTRPGLVPDPRIHYVPEDLLDPSQNDGRTLLYYTGITRLAKNILQQVVGRYLDRDRAAMATLREIHDLPPHVADAMSRKDLTAFGGLIDRAWRLNKQLDPDSSNESVEILLDRVKPHVHGAKLLGAGGGGFLLMICKSTENALAVRDMLAMDPPNPRARFFDFDVSREGLVVTVS